MYLIGKGVFIVIVIVLIVAMRLQPSEAKLFPIAVRLPLLGTPPRDGESLWPMPNYLQTSPESMYINRFLLRKSYDGSFNVCEREIIDKLWSHYQNVLFPPKLSYKFAGSNERKMEYVEFNLKISTPINDQAVDCSRQYYPYFNDNNAEAYELTVDTDRLIARISADTVWGLVKGLETFSQLTYYTPDSYLAINKTTVRDKPRFYHRGIMLDTARHFMPIPLLKKHLDVMMYNKLNVFHWHLVDDQSFPFESDAYPDLHKKGAYTQQHVYTKKQVKDLVEFARIRGIRVIPELDSPGHTYSWGLSFPELITVCWNDGKPLQAVYGQHGAREILNPIQELTYEFIKNLIRDVKNTFRDEYIHLGMDEVYYRCWETNPNISQWMRDNGLTEIRQVEEYYMSRVLTLTRELGYKSIVWQDVWDNNVKVFNDTILQIWKEKKEEPWQNHVQKATQDGYKVILSSPWYLNYIKYGSDWHDYYGVDPHNFTGTDAQKNLVIGGEACLWAEYVDGANSISRFWPRASAVAEKLWSSASMNDVEEAKFRLDDHRCRLLRRGIEAGPVFNSYCGDYEVYMENSLVNDLLFNYRNNHGLPRVSFNFFQAALLIVLSYLIRSAY